MERGHMCALGSQQHHRFLACQLTLLSYGACCLPVPSRSSFQEGMATNGSPSGFVGGRRRQWQNARDSDAWNRRDRGNARSVRSRTRWVRFAERARPGMAEAAPTLMPSRLARTGWEKRLDRVA